MTSSTTEYWEINGVSLNQYAWNITTLGGSRIAVPPLRGENVQYAGRPGKDYRPKVPDSRVITLAMWVLGVDPGTDAPADDQVAQWNDNWRALQRLFWSPREQLTLTRRRRYSSGVETHTALAELAGTMDPQMTGRTRGVFTVDLLLADPFFYGSEVTHTVSSSAVVNNPGDDIAAYSNFQLVFSGGGIRLTNTTPSEADVWVEVSDAVGGTITLDLTDFTATSTSDGNVIGAVTHEGAWPWMVLLPGNNNLSVTDGSVDVVFRAPYV